MAIREHFLTPADRELWRKFMPERSSVYGSLGNALIGEKLLNRVARLHVIESEDGWISYPMHLRSLSQLPFTVDISSRWDSGTPEFTGPYTFGEDRMLAQKYPLFRSSLAQREGIVAEFAHLNPWSGAEQVLNDGSSCDRQIIWSDTTLDPEYLRHQHLEHRCRKCLNKAERAGLRTVEISTPEEIREFVRIYQGTMSRNHALESYYFTEEYFTAFREFLPFNSRFTLTIHQNRAIGALFILFDDENVYAYLGGSDAAFHRLSPATFQIWDTISWAHRNCKKRLVLGGGYAANDGIFRFKASFSPLLRSFYVYRKVHRGEDYMRLDQAFRAFHGLGSEQLSYFPSYRYTPQSAIRPTPVRA
jgi:hypothetical protein